MSAYYNEIDPYAAQWLRNLIVCGLIADGEVDERSITEVQPDDIREFTQCHFFAGIGVWSYAARRAGWADERPLWTGSSPCQPFSVAGRAVGFDDERHLWPHFHHLIRECRPDVVFGEQVASKDGLAWLDLVCADLEGEGYAVGAVDTCAAGVGAPHIRQRLYWVADPLHAGRSEGRAVAGDRSAAGRSEPLRMADADIDGFAEAGASISASRRNGSLGDGAPGGLADATVARSQGDELCRKRTDAQRPTPERSRGVSGMADAEIGGSWTGLRDQQSPELWRAESSNDGSIDRPHPTNGQWRDADWLLCRDGKWRPVEPDTFPLAHGAPARMGRLRAYGNAIVAQVATQVIAAFMECRP